MNIEKRITDLLLLLFHILVLNISHVNIQLFGQLQLHFKTEIFINIKYHNICQKHIHCSRN